MYANLHKSNLGGMRLKKLDKKKGELNELSSPNISSKTSYLSNQ